MTTAVFDTLKAFSKLEAAGMETSQAKAVVDTLAEAFDDNVATKADVAELKAAIVAVRAEVGTLEASTKADLAEVKTELKAEISGVKTDIDKLEASTKAEISGVKADVFRALWIQGAGLVGIQLAIVALLFAAIRFLVLKQPFCPPLRPQTTEWGWSLSGRAFECGPGDGPECALSFRSSYSSPQWSRHGQCAIVRAIVHAHHPQEGF